MQKQQTDFSPRLLVLARKADSVCSQIPAWAASRRWGDLALCHSAGDLLDRLADSPPHQPAILVTRPVMFTPDFIEAVGRLHPSLRLIAWVCPAQVAVSRLPLIPAGSPVIPVTGPDELTSVINALQACDPIKSESAAVRPEPSEDNCFDPKQYRLSSDELDALLGANP